MLLWVPGARQIEKLIITQAAVDCEILRFTPTRDTSGREIGTYDTQTGGLPSEKVWIQPRGATAGETDIRMQGLNAETTHIGFQPWDGMALIAKDQIVPVGEQFVYDVLVVHLFETHRTAELKQVRRE